MEVSCMYMYNYEIAHFALMKKDTMYNYFMTHKYLLFG